MSIKAHVGWALMNKHLIMYWCLWDIWSPTNLVASCVTELDNTLPNLWMSRKDSVGPPTECLPRHLKTALGLGRTRPDSLITSWDIATHGAPTTHRCRVVRFIPMQGWLSTRISVTPSEMGDALIAMSKRSNSTFKMLYLIHEMDVDYLVVKEMVNI
jgi:hypothetical protein